MKPKKTPQKTHRLLIKVIDRKRAIMVDPEGRQLIPVKWIEVEEIMLGSTKKPNFEILSWKYVPIIMAREEE